jgi:hypothetical protein
MGSSNLTNGVSTPALPTSSSYPVGSAESFVDVLSQWVFGRALDTQALAGWSRNVSIEPSGNLINSNVIDVFVTSPEGKVQKKSDTPILLNESLAIVQAGQTISFTLNPSSAITFAAGTLIPFVISGDQLIAGDIGAKFYGVMTADGNGKATVSIPTLPHTTLEGSKALIFSIPSSMYTQASTIGAVLIDALSSTSSASTGTVATFLANASKLSANSFTIVDTLLNVNSSLDALQNSVSKIATIDVGGFKNYTQILEINYSQLSSDASVISKINSTSTLKSSVYEFQIDKVPVSGIPTVLKTKNVLNFYISDTSTNISANLDLLKNELAGMFTVGIQITDAKPLVITQLQLSVDASVMQAVYNLSLALTQVPVSQITADFTNGAVKTVAVDDNCLNIFTNIAQLKSLGSQVSSINITDTAANISSYLDAIQKNVSSIQSIHILDGKALNVTPTQAVTDAAAIKLIQADNVVLNDVQSTYSATIPNQIITGTGSQTVIYSGISSNFAITITGSTISIVDNSMSLGTHTLTNIQRLQFTDTNVALDIIPTQTAGAIYMLYQATFNRTPDAAGLGYWIAQVDKGANIITTAAASFVQSPEFVAKYGSNPTNASYVDNLYQNVLHRAGESGGVAYWNQQLNTGAATKAFVLEQFATLAEGAALVAPAIAHGIAYTQWVG